MTDSSPEKDSLPDITEDMKRQFLDIIEDFPYIQFDMETLTTGYNFHGNRIFKVQLKEGGGFDIFDYEKKASSWEEAWELFLKFITAFCEKSTPPTLTPEQLLKLKEYMEQHPQDFLGQLNKIFEKIRIRRIKGTLG